MIDAVSLQDTSKPMNLPFSNKKSGQNYMYSSHNTSELHVPSITFNGKSNKLVSHTLLQGDTVHTMTVPLVTSTEQVTHIIDRNTIWPVYVTFILALVIAGLLLPYYMTQTAMVLSPLFMFVVLFHMSGMTHYVHIALGGLVIIGYNVVLVGNHIHYTLVYTGLFNLFCVFSLMTEKFRKTYVFIILLLFVCSIMGVVVLKVYPQSIHGIHASFLSSVLLHITVMMLSPACTVQMSKKKDLVPTANPL